MPVLLSDVKESSKSTLVKLLYKAIEKYNWGTFTSIDFLDFNKMEVSTIADDESGRGRRVALSVILNDALIMFAMRDNGDIELPEGTLVGSEGISLAREYYNCIYVLRDTSLDVLKFNLNIER
jgi:hypothetical protein